MKLIKEYPIIEIHLAYPDKSHERRYFIYDYDEFRDYLDVNSNTVLFNLNEVLNYELTRLQGTLFFKTIGIYKSTIYKNQIIGFREHVLNKQGLKS